MDVLAIIQARVGSHRLPNKVLFDLEGKKVLEHIINRVRNSKLISEVVVATTIKKQDLEIVKVCANNDTLVYCGSENDVLDRYYQTARLLQPKNIVRITADCPLIDFEVIDEVIKKHTLEEADYTSNTIERTYPDGLDVEVLSFNTLHTIWSEAKLDSEREHVTPYIRNNRKKFKIAQLIDKKDLSNKRWTLDYQEDYEFIREIYAKLFNKNNLFNMEEIIGFINRNPEIEKINRHHSKR